MEEILRSLFLDQWCSKVVTPTDKKKGALVATIPVREVLDAAGWEALDGGDPTDEGHDVITPWENSPSLNTSYYKSLRQDGRDPEYRLGRELIHWLDVGDTVYFAARPPDVVAFRVRGRIALNHHMVDRLVQASPRTTSSAELRRRLAREIRQGTSQQVLQVSTTRQARSTTVVLITLLRADGRCEMPRCTTPLFRNRVGEPYLEVHHIIPLSEGGDDLPTNTAALCPRCHRMQHHANNAETLRATLALHVASLERGA